MIPDGFRPVPILFAALLLTFQVACSGTGPPAFSLSSQTALSPTPSPTGTVLPSPQISRIPTLAPPSPLPTSAPPTASPTATSGSGLGDYIDDRSTPESVMASFVNALNHKQYARAYGYWESGASRLPAFAQFRQGYANTASVQLTMGTVGSNAGAGQLYFTVPVTLVARTTDGATQTYVGCYTLHLARPEIQSAPPFRPMGISSAKVNLVENSANTAELMKTSCR